MKKYVILLLFFALLLTGVCRTDVLADSSSGRKVVTIVFDDSWSMTEANRYSNANYAIQAFIALLDEEDELYLVYMSDVARAVAVNPGTIPSGLAYKVDLSDPQAGVDQVRAKEWTGTGTPYGSVQTGYRELLAHPDTSPSVSYYLIVMTDGGFMDDATNQTVIDPAEVQAQFESFCQTPMPNQTTLNTYYLAIGPESVPMTDRPDLSFHALTATDGASMIHTIGQMADMISGRYRLDASEIAMADANTVMITSPLPLKSIAFLSQGREAAVSGVAQADGTACEIVRNVSLSPDAYNTDASLFGNAILAQGAGGQNIPAGTYTVQFTSQVDLNTLTVMYEPAIDCRLTFFCRGQEIPAEALPGLMEGEEITVQAKAVEAGTDREIDPALLSAETSWHLSYQAGENEVQEQDGTQMTILVRGGENRIVGSLTMPGFLPVTDDVRFDMDSILYGVKADKDKVSARQNELDGCEAIRFSLTGNGEILEKEDAMRYELSEPEITGGSLDYDWNRQEDGSYLFKPKGKSDSLGELTVNVSIKGLPDVLTQLGAMQLNASAVVELLPKIEYRVEIEQPQSEARQNKLGECEPILFFLSADGVRLTAEELLEYPLSEPAVSGGHLEYLWEFDEEKGCYRFTPSGMTEDTGVITVTTGSEEIEAEGSASLTVLPKIQYAIEASSEESSARQRSLKKAEPLLFYITADGRRMSREEVMELELVWNTRFEESGFFIWDTGERKAGFSRKITIEDDGGIMFWPSGRSWFYGTAQVTLTMPDEAQGSAVFVIEKDMWIYWSPIMGLCILLFLIWCAVGWLRQPKFRNQIMEIVVYTKFGAGIQESPRIKVMKRRFGPIPWRACRMRVGDMVFTAGDNGKILLNRDCVSRRIVYAGKVRFMGRNAGNMARLLRMMEPTKRDIRLVRGMEVYVADDKQAEVITGYRLTSN